jgi:TrmH family RNA methyltransferase
MLHSEFITSPNNSKIKLIRSLQARRRNRESEGAFIAEGVRLVEEAIAVGWPISFLLFDETLSERGMSLLNQLDQKQNYTISQVSPELMASISDTETPQGILAVLQRQTLPLSDSPTFLLIADQIRDPGNMGTLIRTAEAAGADAVLIPPGTVDAFSPKVIRAGMRGHFHIPILSLDWTSISEYIGDLPVFLADAEGGTPLWEVDFCQPCVLLVGGESFGASPEGKKFATQRVTIPMRGRAESLNAAIAAGLLIGEVLRQRYST